MTFVGPRVYAAMAEDGFLPRALAAREGQVPVGSVILQGVIAILIVLGVLSASDVLPETTPPTANTSPMPS